MKGDSSRHLVVSNSGSWRRKDISGGPASDGCQSRTSATHSPRSRRRRRIAEVIEPLLAEGHYLDSDGEQPTSCSHVDLLVVTPYNAQVRCLHHLPSGWGQGRHGRQVPGTAGPGRVLLDGDLLAGWELPRIWSSCSAETASTSRSLAPAASPAWSASPALLDTQCRSIEQMRLVNALCRFAEVAGEIHQTVSAK